MLHQRRILSPEDTRLLRDHVRLHGLDPDAFQAWTIADGTIAVRSPTAAAFYPRKGWLARFDRHLRLGYFQDRRQTAAA